MRATSVKSPPLAAAAPPWRSAPERPPLGSDEVHVWRATLERSPSQIRGFRCTLAADERARAERYHFEKDRECFIVARGLLRAILGAYVDTSPDSLRFCYGSHGKPALARESGGTAIRFNMSHSHGVAVYAVARDREVGIDVERVRRDLETDQIAERFFSRREAALLRALPPEVQPEAFFLGWTRKEAFIKARGEGLSLPLDQFDVSLAPGEPAALLDVHQDPSEASRWSLRELSPAPGYAAALAVEGHGWRLKCWESPDPRQ